MLQSSGSGQADLSSCALAYLPCSMWNLPGPGVEPVSPALVGRFLATGPSGKSHIQLLYALSSTVASASSVLPAPGTLALTSKAVFFHLTCFANSSDPCSSFTFSIKPTLCPPTAVGVLLFSSFFWSLCLSHCLVTTRLIIFLSCSKDHKSSE